MRLAVVDSRGGRPGLWRHLFHQAGRQVDGAGIFWVGPRQANLRVQFNGVTSGIALPANPPGCTPKFTIGYQAGFWGSTNDHVIDTFTTIISNDPNITLDIFSGGVWSTYAAAPLIRIAAMIPVVPDPVLINYVHNLDISDGILQVGHTLQG